MLSGKFISQKDESEFKTYMASWSKNSLPVKEAFFRLYHILSGKPEVGFDFNIRPGVSASFKSYHMNEDNSHSKLFSVIDIIDQDPQNIWLSVCFYADTITDPDDSGNLIPDGLLEEDGYCFDVFEQDDGLMKYLEIRIDEAYEKVLKD